MDRKMQDEIRQLVASWNAQKMDAAGKSMQVGHQEFTNLHNERTRRLISVLGNASSAVWWEGLAELATNACHMIRSNTVSPSVRVLDPLDVKMRDATNKTEGHS